MAAAAAENSHSSSSSFHVVIVSALHSLLKFHFQLTDATIPATSSVKMDNN
jgi:hypothetical protein